MISVQIQGGGAVLSDHLQLSVLNLARIVLSLFAVTGLISIALNLLFERSLWAYLVGTFLQSSVMCMSLVSAQVRFPNFLLFHTP